MASVDTTAVRLAGIELVDASTGHRRDVGDLDGVHVMVLMRHRH
jgi:hypothetical protein